MNAGVLIPSARFATRTARPDTTRHPEELRAPAGPGAASSCSAGPPGATAPGATSAGGRRDDPLDHFRRHAAGRVGLRPEPPPVLEGQPCEPGRLARVHPQLRRLGLAAIDVGALRHLRPPSLADPRRASRPTGTTASSASPTPPATRSSVSSASPPTGQTPRALAAPRRREPRPTGDRGWCPCACGRRHSIEQRARNSHGPLAGTGRAGRSVDVDRGGVHRFGVVVGKRLGNQFPAAADTHLLEH